MSRRRKRHLDWTNKASPSPIPARDLVPDGWEIVEDVITSTMRAISDLELVPLSEEEGYVSGEAMQERAVQSGANLGLADGRRIMERQGEIPAEMRGKILLLPGTLLCDSDDKLRIACLSCSGGGCWYLDFYFTLDDGFGGRCRLLRYKQQGGNSDP